ncbi:hypothetical protein GCM10011578_005290 [Streptomyces fuscichromogenes]|uniref:Uncharacterized protein n=1 Tax=Streptomyces fuscichromogenes TaxID=1324013 RepID=A0A917UFH6_9ACTN|nr:hypothetical protein GCM10011578_005290 [Streptomyces fuscichromogenes]
MLLRLAYLGMASVFAMLRLLPMSDRDMNVEVLALRHQIAVLERQLNGRRVRFDAGDRAFPAAPLQGLPPEVLRRMWLLARPDTVLAWHRGLVTRRHAARSRPKRGGDRAPRDPSAPWSCGSRGRIPAGAAGACTVNCSSSA